MSRRTILAVALVALLTIPAYAWAHEGHAHKVMGTVTARHENHLEVKGTDGKSTTMTLNEKTKVLRGNAKATAEEIKPGDRVVVTTVETKENGKTTIVATQIRLGAAASK